MLNPMSPGKARNVHDMSDYVRGGFSILKNWSPTKVKLRYLN